MGSPVSAEFVNDGARRGNQTIDRDDLSGANKNRFANVDLVNGDVFNRLANVPVSGSRGSIHEGLEISLRACHSKILEHRPACVHYSDHDPCECLSQSKRCDHRQEGDGIDAHPAAEEIAGDGHRESDHDGQRGSAPNPMSEGALASCVCCKAGDETQ